MPIPACAFPNTQSVTTHVQQWIEKHDVPFDHLIARPWNRYDPVNTEWWLIPTSDWPAYRYGKYFFDRLDDSGNLFCGLYLEKGLDPAVAIAYPTGKKYVMDQDWRWHRLMTDMRGDAFAQATAQAVAVNPNPLLLRIDGGFVEDPGSYDPQAPKMDWNYLWFGVESSVIRHVKSELHGAQFRRLEVCETLVELADAIAAIRDLAWTWINFSLGYELAFASLEPATPPDPDPWDAPQIWSKCLAAWAPWVV